MLKASRKKKRKSDSDHRKEKEKEKIHKVIIIIIDENYADYDMYTDNKYYKTYTDCTYDAMHIL